MDLSEFAAAVGRDGPVTCVGGGTQWHVGGAVDPAARPVRAPAGIVEHVPAEMIVRCGAGTTIGELDAALAEAGQFVALPEWPDATVGGALAVGHSGLRALGHGPVRDTLLEARFVTADGLLVKAGGPVVKNVTGFDLCRLLVGSLGTLGFLGEVVLRCRPRPLASRWLAGEADPFAARRGLYRPASILWDGTTTWVCLEGHPDDVASEASSLGPAFTEVEGPPPVPGPGRLSMAPGDLRSLTGAFFAQVGVGIVHVPEPVPPRPLPPGVAELNRRVKERFDPAGRLNPGRVVA